MAAGAEAFLEDAGCWQASLQNARELLEAAGTRERARVGGSGRRVDGPRAWLAPGSPEEGTTSERKGGALPLAGSELFSLKLQNNIPGGLHFAPLPSPRAYGRILEECRRNRNNCPELLQRSNPKGTPRYFLFSRISVEIPNTIVNHTMSLKVVAAWAAVMWMDRALCRTAAG